MPTCQICQNEYSTNSIFNHHLRSVHKNDPNAAKYIIKRSWYKTKEQKKEAVRLRNQRDYAKNGHRRAREKFIKRKRTEFGLEDVDAIRRSCWEKAPPPLSENLPSLIFRHAPKDRWPRRVEDMDQGLLKKLWLFFHFDKTGDHDLGLLYSTLREGWGMKSGKERRSAWTQAVLNREDLEKFIVRAVEVEVKRREALLASALRSWEEERNCRKRNRL